MWWRNGNEQLFKMATTKHPPPTPTLSQHTYTHACTYLHKPINPKHSEESRHLQYHSTHNQDSVPRPGSAAPSPCPVQWGLMECIISWQMHAFTQKRKVILTFSQKKKKEKNYNWPQEENARPFINRPERKNERCLFTDSGAFTKCKSSIANVRRFK